MTFTLLNGAKHELFEAASRYEHQRAELGNEFLDEVVQALKRLESHPRSRPRVEGSYRRCLVRRFPYALIYRSKLDVIIVVAVMHLKRRPGYWRRRAVQEDQS